MADEDKDMMDSKPAAVVPSAIESDLGSSTPEVFKDEIGDDSQQPAPSEEEEPGMGTPNDAAAPDIERPPNVEEEFVEEQQAVEGAEGAMNTTDMKQPVTMQSNEAQKVPAAEPMREEPPAPLVADPSLLKPPPPDSTTPVAPDVVAPLMTEQSHLKPPPQAPSTKIFDAAPSPPPPVAPPSGTIYPDAAEKTAAAASSNQPATMPGAVASQPGAVPSQEPDVGKAKEMGAGVPAEQTEGPLGTKQKEGGDPLKQPPEEGKDQQPQKKREINKDFRDVQTTGRWGDISQTEVYVVAAVVVVIVVVVIIVIAVVASGGESTEESVPPATMAPTAKATSLPPEELLSLLRNEWQSNPVTSQVPLVNDPSYYADTLENGNCTETPLDCAMSWALFEDAFPPPTDDIATRFAMANLYYSLGGDDWIKNTNWLTSSSYCDWYGVNCNRLQTEVEELNFDGNNLTGELPVALALVSPISVISLKNNAIGGLLPADIFAGMPNLFVLYLQGNRFTGPIPDNLQDNGALGKVWWLILLRTL
ncbi:leucine Rich Repeat [Seminavis robusta]|uniref:Leucine Rich Repeat n=1 Tax=Seminavis robusta TaxID=568900 RepID=A0A9N8H981_9STRA|nr:leucine Rich Repeat [Seminavis robusta]|eukprot:Sro196_g083570.1 leucine Rich Repeat (533) ;mRNA; r:61851-63449